MRVSIDQLIEAAKENGYPWGQGSPYDGGSAFCVLSQACLNLGISAYRWAELSIRLDDISEGLGADIWRFNDAEASSYDDAFDYLQVRLSPYRDLDIEIE